MAFDGNGNYVRIHNWTQDAANALDINAGEMDAEDNSIAGAFNLCVTRDGQGKMTTDFLPDTDNVLNLGTQTKRWATINGIATSSFLSNQPGTGFFYSQSGARINRLQDRVFVGDAAVNDGQGPTNPVSADWLTLWQQSLGIAFGSITSTQFASLTTSAAAAVTSPSAAVFGTRSLNSNQNAQNFIATEAYAVNNSPSFTNSVWAHYAESHRVNNVVGAAIGHEIDSTQRGALVGINPYVQNFGQTVSMQLASGAQQGASVTATFATNVMTVVSVNLASDTGLIQVGWRVKCVGVDTTIASFGTGTGGTGTYNLTATPGTLSSRVVAVSPMFDNTVAFNVQANPNSYFTGINFGANSIAGTDGINGIPSPAIQFGRFHGMFWFAGAGVGTCSIYSDASAFVGSPSLQLGQSSFFVREASSNGANFQVALTTNAVNTPFVQGGVTGSAATIGALGGDTNVDLGIFCAGTGLVKFVGGSMLTPNGAVATTMTSLGPTGSHATVQEWLTVKNSAGTVRYIPCY